MRLLFIFLIGGIFSVQQVKSQINNTASNPFFILQIGDSHVDIGVFPVIVRRELNLDSAQLNSAWLYPDFLIKPHYAFPFKLKHTGRWYERNLRNFNDLHTEIGVFGRLFYLDSKKAKWKFKKAEIQTIEFIHPVLDASCSISVKSGSMVTQKIGSSNLEITRISVEANKKRKLQILFRSENKKDLEIYAFRVNSKLVNSNEYHCFGLSGGKFSHYWEQNSVFQKQVKSLHPTLFCIALGTNDSYANDLDTLHYKANLALFLQEIQAGDSTMQLLLSTPPFTRYKGEKPRYEAFINRIIREVATEQKCMLWDLQEEMTSGKNNWSDLKLYAADGLHFTDKGYEIQALLFLRFLAEQAGKREKSAYFEKKIQEIEPQFAF